jgi:hypothetical protein
VVQRFGVPCAVVRDLGRAMIKACNALKEEVEADFPILGCHWHFLADIGKDLLEASHNQLRELSRRFGLKAELRKLSRDLGRRLGPQLAGLRQDITEWMQTGAEHVIPAGDTGTAIVRALAQWPLDYAQDSDRRSFPFDRPYLDFYYRCRMIRRSVDAFLRIPPQETAVRRALERLARILDPVVTQASFAAIAATLSHRAGLFDELRTALRLTARSHSPADRAVKVEETTAELAEIQQALDSFVQSLRQRRPERGPAQDQRQAIDLILKHLERHGASLWGHLVTLTSETGPLCRAAPRTNNDLEGFFRHIKQGERRRSGRKILTQDFESLHPAAPLIQNLTRPDYVELLCGSLAELPQAFAKLDQAFRGIEATTPDPGKTQIPEVASASLPRVDRPVLRAAGFRQRIEVAARSRAPRYNPPVTSRSS